MSWTSQPRAAESQGVPRRESELSNVPDGSGGEGLLQTGESVRPMRETGWRFVILAAVAGFMFGNFYFFDQTSATGKAVQKRANMTEDTFGLLSSVYSYPNVILPLFGGLAIDVFGVRFACVLYTGLTLLGSCIFTVGLSCQSTLVLIIGRVIFGMGGESQNVASLVIVSKYFKGRELAFAIGIDIAVSRLGSVAAFDTQGKWSQDFGVTWASGVGSVICLFSMCSVLCAVALDYRCDRKDAARGLEVVKATADETVSLTDIAKFGAMYWCITVSCVTTYVAAFPFLQVLSQPYLENRFDFDNSATADEIASVINLTSAFLSPVLGLFVDRFGFRPLLLTLSSLAFVVAMTGFLVWPHCSHCYSVISLYGLMGVALSVYGAVIWASVPLVVDEHTVGTAFGLTTALQNMGMAISPMVITYLHSSTKTAANPTGTFTFSFLYILCCVGIGFVSGVVLWVLDGRGDKRLMKGRSSAITDSVAHE